MGIKRIKKQNKKSNAQKTCKKNLFKKAITEARNAIRTNINCCGTTSLATIALKAAKNVIKNKNKNTITTPRIIPVPKVGGFLPFLTSCGFISSWNSNWWSSWRY